MSASARALTIRPRQALQPLILEPWPKCDRAAAAADLIQFDHEGVSGDRRADLDQPLGDVAREGFVIVEDVERHMQPIRPHERGMRTIAFSPMRDPPRHQRRRKQGKEQAMPGHWRGYGFKHGGLDSVRMFLFCSHC